jgi:hypothetical protein
LPIGYGEHDILKSWMLRYPALTGSWNLVCGEKRRALSMFSRVGRSRFAWIWRDAYLDFSKAANAARTTESKAFFWPADGRVCPVRAGDGADQGKMSALLVRLARERTGGSANDARKRFSSAWKWVQQSMTNFPDVNPFQGAGKFPVDSIPRYVPPYEDFVAVLGCADAAEYAILLTALHTAARRAVPTAVG